MARRTERPPQLRPGVRWIMALGMLVLAAFFLYRGKAIPAEKSPLPSPTVTPAAVTEAAEHVKPTPALSTPENTPEPTVPAEEMKIELAEPTPGVQQTPQPQRKIRPIVYDQRSYQLVTDMVYAFRMQLPDREQIIAADVAALKEHDAALGEAWGGIMEYWDYADTRLELNYDRLPENLPQDDSLCIVVLGFQLLPDGSMAPEMLGRCELALAAARQYPKAYLAVTGGGTAAGNAMVTEAGVMAEWFLEQGIDENRIIREDRSSTTDENAKFTLQILTGEYPQIKSIAVVTSDYHVLHLVYGSRAALRLRARAGALDCGCPRCPERLRPCGIHQSRRAGTVYLGAGQSPAGLIEERYKNAIYLLSEMQHLQEGAGLAG